MILIFAVDNNWNIGVNGDMLTAIPDDLTRFRLLTENNIIVMGRKTLEALPEQEPLANRINILVTRNEGYYRDGFHIIHSLDQLPELLSRLNPSDDMEVFVIGGGNIAIQLLSQCKRAYITKILEVFPLADTCIPNLDREEGWRLEKESEIFNFNGLKYKYVNYVRE
ncbi:MAG: dihydrofolate reductase [Tissierellaceae bacterium]